MALYLPIVLLKIQYRDANPVPTSPLDDDLATAPSGPAMLLHNHIVNSKYVNTIIESRLDFVCFLKYQGHALAKNYFNIVKSYQGYLTSGKCGLLGFSVNTQ